MPFKFYSLDDKLALIGDLVETALAAGQGYGCEIGVFKAKTSLYLLNRFPKLCYVGIDPYPVWNTLGVKPIQAIVAEGIREKQWFESLDSAEAMYQNAIAVYSQFSGRVNLIRQRSSEAAKAFATGIFDFVYIDGDHGYEAVLTDIGLYREKLRPGGILLGDDFSWKGSLNNVGKAVVDSFGFDYGMLADTWFWRKPCK